MTIHYENMGKGPTILFLHGWGLNSQVWIDIASNVKTHYSVKLIDLPGHGKSTYKAGDFELTTLSDQIASNLQDGSILVGWSLGGVVAHNIAIRHPKKVSKLVMVSSNAQFVSDENWRYGIKSAILELFANDLFGDFKNTLNKFLMLQCRGDENMKQTVKQLKQRLFSSGEPDVNALRAGLAILRETSMVEKLKQISCPTLLIYGQLDALVPVGAANVMHREIQNSHLSIFEKSAHAPFISHQAEFLKILMPFLND